MKQNKTNESGRSMVEMLGVLAVIGVLSIGGIAGYKYAMNQIKLHKIYQLIDRFSVAAVAEREKGADSFLLDTSLTPREKNDMFCSLYAPGYCSTVYEYNGSTDEAYYLLVEKFIGAETPTKGHYWRVYGRTELLPRCTCITDLSVVVSNLPKKTCESLLDTVISLYSDKGLVGFFGYEMAYFPLSNDKIKENICHSEKNFVEIIFEGYDNTRCAACGGSCPCE